MELAKQNDNYIQNMRFRYPRNRNYGNDIGVFHAYFAYRHKKAVLSAQRGRRV